MYEPLVRSMPRLGLDALSSVQPQIEGILRDMRKQVLEEPQETVGSLFGNCTQCARHVISQMGRGTIWGYPEASAIGAQIGECDLDGHDFAIVDHFLVDHWANDYLQKPWLYDLTVPGDLARVKREYGDSARWLRFDPGMRRFLPSAADPLSCFASPCPSSPGLLRRCGYSQTSALAPSLGRG